MKTHDPVSNDPTIQSQPLPAQGVEVPREPTPEMIEAGRRQHFEDTAYHVPLDAWLERIYKAMIAAAPPSDKAASPTASAAQPKGGDCHESGKGTIPLPEDVGTGAAHPHNAGNAVQNGAVDLSRALSEQHTEQERAAVERGCNHWPGQTRCDVCGMGKTATWHHVHTVDELEQFYWCLLPAIRDAARLCGYAIGVHGSMRRDLDLIAVPWVEAHSTPDALATAIQQAATGGIANARFDWSSTPPKPCGRIATAFPICWTHWHDQISAGHVDLSVMLPPRTTPATPREGSPITRSSDEQPALSSAVEALRELVDTTDNFCTFLAGERGVELSSADYDDHNVYKFLNALGDAKIFLRDLAALKEPSNG